MKIKALLLETNPEITGLLRDLSLQDSSHSLELKKVSNLTPQLEALRAGAYQLCLLDLTKSGDSEIDELHGPLLHDLGVPTIVLSNGEDRVQRLAERACVVDVLTERDLCAGVLPRVIRFALEKNELQKRLIASSQYDQITGLPNRQKFHVHLAEVVQRARSDGNKAALLFLDLDEFKRVNDTLGHESGDGILKLAANRLQGALRDGDMVARLGGDEFVVVLNAVRDADEVNYLAQAILRVLSEPFAVRQHEIYMTVSIGISVFPDDGEDAGTLFKKADVAMYCAKGSGRNIFRHYRHSMDATFKEHLSLESDLRRAIENKELVVYYQPQVNLQTGRIVGLEALVRWEHPQLGLVFPAKFIPLAEKTGIIVSIDQWVLAEACRQSKRWLETYSDDLRISVNLSAQQFRRRNFPELVNRTLAQTGFPPQNLCLEITESSVMHQVDTGITILDSLKKIGVRLSVDDFGTGHSSLNYLKRFPLDALKVDRSFVRDIPHDREDMAISTAIVVLAKSMALEVVAEGVETREQLSFFRSLDCDTFQGYVFSEPVPASCITQMFEEDRHIVFDDLTPVVSEVEE